MAESGGPRGAEARPGQRGRPPAIRDRRIVGEGRPRARVRGGCLLGPGHGVKGKAGGWGLRAGVLGRQHTIGAEACDGCQTLTLTLTLSKIALCAAEA